MEKINIEGLHFGRDVGMGGRVLSGTEAAIEVVAEKLNEVVEKRNKLEDVEDSKMG